MRALFAQAAASLGVTVTELIGILAAVVAPLASAIIYVVKSKDSSLSGQAAAHLGEREAWAKAQAAKDAFIERLVEARAKDQQEASDARARDAADARAAVVQVSTEAMRIVDAMRAEPDFSTPTSPAPRDSRTSLNPALSEGAGPATRRPGGGRRSNA